MSNWLDIALVFDRTTMRGDLALGDDGDLLIDETPATPMEIAFGSDRRARQDDDLPTGITELNEPTSLVERRGWAGDALDAEGRLIGSRLWLLDRAKENELTRMMGEEWTREAYAWVEPDTGRAPDIEVGWVRSEVLGVRARVDGRAVAIARRVGQEAA